MLINSKDSVGLARFNKENGEALKNAIQQRLKLGLDLRGGMYVTLEADVVRLIEESVNKDANDDLIAEILDKTRKEAATSEEPVLNIFRKNFDAIARPKGRTLLSYFEVRDVKNSTEEAILKQLEKDVDGAVDQAKEVIRQRIDKYGLSEPSIQKQGTRRIVIELPGVKNEGEVRQLLQTTARLEFKLVRNTSDLARAFYQIDQLLKSKNVAGKEATKVAATDTSKAATTVSAKPDSSKTVATTDTTKKDSAALAAEAAADTTNPYAGLAPEEAQRRFKADYPFTSLFLTYFINNEQPVQIGFRKNQFPDGDYVFQVPSTTMKEFEAILQRPDVKRVLAGYSVGIAAKPYKATEKQEVQLFEFYGLKADAELTGDVISDARATFDQSTSQPMVLMEMKQDGAEKWAKITGQNIKKRIAIVLDERVYSAPTVQNKITGGSSQITGSSTIEEAKLLEIVLKAGALKAPVTIVEERVVGPSLGEDSIKSGVLSFIAAFIMVIFFMVMYYAMGGVVANLAVLLNVLLIVASLASSGATLTLPGIAGIVLTVGMAVDANILIYERIREELREGRTLKAAIDEGYGKALTAIVDSNITTFLTGLILYYMGSGPVQGFAVTLMIGIIMTMFTAVIVTKAIFKIMLSRGVTEFNFGQPKA